MIVNGGNPTGEGIVPPFCRTMFFRTALQPYIHPIRFVLTTSSITLESVAMSSE